MTKFVAILFAGLALTFSGPTALQAAKNPDPPAYSPPDCMLVPASPSVMYVTPKPSVSSSTRIPPSRN